DRKVHIGHDLPINLELTAEYAEDDVPIQVYLLNINDIEEVQSGIGDISDIRMYYIERTSFTTLDSISAGTGTYYLTINIPANDGRDVLTGDYKTGTFCVVGEVNKGGEAEIDAYEVYKKFQDRLEDTTYREENTILVTTEYMSKPDLSIEEMNFTGGSEEAQDVITFLDLDLSNLPGADQFTIDVPGFEMENPLATPFHIVPSEPERTFMGNIHVRSSSNDALNVPITFELNSNDSNVSPTISIPLEIYDSDIGGWVTTYYIPLMKANVTERVNLALRIPDDGDWDTEEDVGEDPDAMAIRERIGDVGDVYGTYTFQIEGEINPGGAVTEARFMASQDGEYDPDGNNSTAANNTYTESIIINIEKMEVEPNEGIKLYPYDKISSSPTDDDKQLVIFWDGFGFNVGDGDFGAIAQIHEGCLFRNFSLYSLGASAEGTIFGNTTVLIDAYLNAICTPRTATKTAFDFYVEANDKVYFSDFGLGFSENDWNYPITLFSQDFEKEMWYSVFRFKIVAGIDIIFTPGVRLDLNSDGSLCMGKYMALLASADVDASVSVGGVATVGVYTYCDVMNLEIVQNTYTKTVFQNVVINDETVEQVSGSVYRDFGIYLTGPAGYVDLYLEIDFGFFSKQWSWEIFRYTSFMIPIVEFNIDSESGNKWTTYLNY
ncbi:MAG: hypothetical protein GY754_02420, partial [bacterium]|nr:hypothetical protein [bacterium]